MRQLIRLLLIPGAIGWLLGGCSEKIEPKPTTYSQLLTGTTKKTWRAVSFQIIDDGDASPVTPISQSGVDRCIYDDYLTFYADSEHKLEASEGPSKCASNAPDIYLTDSWDLVNATASLTFYIPVLDGKYVTTLKTLTANSFTVELYFQDINASYRFTFNPVSQ